jgi:type IV secretion system protein VirB9
MPLVAFNYPFDESREAAKVAAATEEAETRHEPVSVPPENMNFAYRIDGGKVVWKPLRVFDDGTKTYLQMPPAMKSWEAPALFVLDDGRAPQIVNYRVKGDFYIVDRLFHRAQLRVGTKHFVDVYRDGPSG